MSHIDLTPHYWSGIAQFKAEIKAAKAIVEEKEAELLVFQKNAQAAFTSQLDAGATTGNPLKDDALRFFGFDAERIEKLVAFDQKLVEAKGQEFLIISHTQKRTRFGGQGDECANDYQDVYHATLGVLSGDHLHLVSNDKLLFPQIVFPFARHVHSDEAPKWGSGHVGCAHLAPYATSAGDLELHYMFFGLILGIAGGQGRLSIFLGDEIASKDIGSVGAVLEGMRKVLQAPTEAEKVAAAGI